MSEANNRNRTDTNDKFQVKRHVRSCQQRQYQINIHVNIHQNQQITNGNQAKKDRTAVDRRHTRAFEQNTDIQIEKAQ